ncbi:OLC1v1017652C1 [Oldenlandia corymbosa var. corymbosa]|uniref:OLC1v1017652C1 n=1 Tax=Oldenlandia corymbosa var. corymbosa TaxID=529605 RepID=A0AAV1EA09_OLDCO|nr:OLC1v1017652C1 [Oldenlandia corymbosa var. corymbosa]
MVSNTSVKFFCIAFFVKVLIFMTPSSTYAQGSPNSSKTVDDFCNQRSTSEDRAFCLTVLKSNPRSATATDNISLLKIAKDLAVGNAKKTRDFFTTLTKNNGTRPSLLPVLDECISAYDESITELLLVTQDLVDDPPMTAYDAHVANQEMNRCQDILKTNGVSDDFILSRHKIASDYGRLIEEIAKSI